MSFAQDDLQKFEMFKTLVNKTKIEIQGDAVITAASLIQWFYGLKNKIEIAIEEKNFKEMTEKKDAIKESDV